MRTNRVAPVVAINSKGRAVYAFRTAHSVQEMGFDPSDVRKVCSGERYTHKGYTWKALSSSQATSARALFAKKDRVAANKLSI